MAEPGQSSSPVLDLRSLSVRFFTDRGPIQAVAGLTFSVRRGEIFGLVGESGSGKTATVLAIMRLIDPASGTVEGEVFFNEIPLLQIAESEIESLRGSQLSMIFQDPQAYLNPVFTIGTQVAEVFQIHEGLRRREAWKRAVELLRLVGIPDPERRARAYPHELSGGQAQRVMIAMALALDPQLLIADEPTTALDVTIQAQILDLMRELIRRSNTSLILITHDLGVIAEMAARVAVMYAGHIVEETDVETLFDRPLHPYTQGLIASVPAPGEQKERLDAIPGTVPDLLDMPPGCRFAARCVARQQYHLKICTERDPDLIELQHGHKVRCYLYQSHGDHRAPLGEAAAP